MNVLHWRCLFLDNVTEIGREVFYGCTSLKTLKIPKCTRFGNYIVTGCKALTRIEATATGDFLDIIGNSSIENYAVFTTEILIPERTHSLPPGATLC